MPKVKKVKEKKPEFQIVRAPPGETFVVKFS